MSPHIRAMIAAAAYTFVTGKTVAGLYDHAAGQHRRIAAEARGEHLQGFDGDRPAKFGGTLPEIYDAGDAAFVSMTIEGMTASGYDRGSSSHYAVAVSGQSVQVHDHGAGAWFAFDVQTA